MTYVFSLTRGVHLSARDVYEELHKSGVELESKGVAVGFRIEHPQWLINEIQYGQDWGGRVVSQRVSCGYQFNLTSVTNVECFEYSCTLL